MYKNVTLTLILLYFSFLTYGQAKLDYDNDSRWFWGINVGSTWHSTDVKTKTDWGYGFTLGRSFNYNYGKIISFDFRGRYLYGEWLGQNNGTTNFDRTNLALSKGATNYKDSLGFSVLNFQTRMHRAALELVVHANSLRERTGWDLYVFGGVGISAFQTRGNLLDSKNQQYDYANLDDLKTGTLNGVLDKSYETTLDGSTPGRGNLIMAPSLGFGFGYQVAKRFSMGLEHKTTFTRIDHFDGYNNPDGSRENDLYHYTSAYLRFQVKKRNWGGSVGGNGGGGGTVDPMRGPDVFFTNPSNSGSVVTSPSYIIRATVREVNGRENINFRQNGVYMGNFTYNASSDRMECQVSLMPGQNTFEIIASNAYGSDQESTIVVYQLPQAPMPIVTILNPATNPYTTSNASYQLTANVLNLQQYNQASVNVNGQLVQNFNFNPTNGQLNLGLNLTVGTNMVTVTGTNQVGTDSKTVTIIYNPSAVVQIPVVYYIDPAQNPYQTDRSSYAIHAQVLNVSGKENIVFKQNGSVNQNFTYNANSDDLYSTVVLNSGQNVFEIIASNTAGVAQATTIIINNFTAPRPPVVTITNPPLAPFNTENSSFQLSATVLNISSASQVRMTLNGTPITYFDYVANTHNLAALLNLSIGNNTVVITATNNDGTDTKQTVIIYKKAVSIQPPLVTFVNPSVNPYNSANPNMAINATVLNIESSTGINVNFNGNNVTGFNFNTSSKALSFTTNLIEGANVITVTATNIAGIDSKSTTVIYKKPEVILPPVVTFTDPITNPLTVYQQTYLIKARIQHVIDQQYIQVKINGNSTSTFVFNPATEIISISTGLVVGANSIEIKATNSAGSDTKSTTLIFKQTEPLLAPSVLITSPLTNPYVSNTSSTNIEATVLNIGGAQNIQVLINNVPFTGFNYLLSSRKLSFIMPLNEGSNNLLIIATNATGSAQDSRVINYTKEVKIDPPKVTFIKPNKPGLIVNNPNYTVIASVLNIENVGQILVEQNGQLVNPSLYSYTASTKEMTFNTGLSLGNNTFTVRASNSAGTNSATTNVVYKMDEVPCDKPTLKILIPNASGIEIVQSKNEIKLLTSNVTSANQIQVLINGVAISGGNFNPSSKIYDAPAIYTLGQNTVEVIITNACGTVKESVVVMYKPAGNPTPCAAPAIQLIQPLRQVITVEAANYEVRLGVLNISEAKQIIFTVNGKAQAFNYDATTHIIISDVNLSDGLNTIETMITNDCGSASYGIKITRKTCKNPEVKIVSSSVANNSSTYQESITLEGTVANVSSPNQFVLTQNGKAVSTVFNLAQQSFSASIDLVMGKNIFELKVTNDCGTASETLVVERKKDPNAVPPTIQITNPATTPYSTNDGAFNIQAVTTKVTAANQVSLTINGQAVNANYNVQSASLSYNLTLVEGNNVIVASAVNNYGTASDSKTIVYTKPIVIVKPTIVLTQPGTCPATLPAGVNQIKGYILNITDLNQVSIKINQVNVTNFNPILVNGKLNFQFNVNLTTENNDLMIDITAANAGGSDAKSCEVKMQVIIDTENCKPTVSALFSGDSKTVTANSTKDLSNVVLKYFDGTVQKFEGLTGLSKGFSGTGTNAGKCIIGVWIKSGCNQSGDGPGYGEWIANTQNVGNCVTDGGGGNDCMPTVSAIFSADSKTVTANSTKELSNVVLKYFDGQEQKFDALIGNSKTFVGTGANTGKCITGIWIKSGCNQSNDGAGYGQWVANGNSTIDCNMGNGNNGHGNNTDGVDESNPGQGGGGPNGETGGTTDDENGKGTGGNKPPVNGGGNNGGGKIPPTNTGNKGTGNQKVIIPSGKNQGTGTKPTNTGTVKPTTNPTVKPAPTVVPPKTTPTVVPPVKTGEGNNAGGKPGTEPAIKTGGAKTPEPPVKTNPQVPVGKRGGGL